MRGVELSEEAAADALSGLRLPHDRDVVDAFARVWWTVLAEPGDGAAGDLVARFGPERALRIALAETDDEWSTARARWQPRVKPSAVRAALDAARRSGAALLIPSDPRWPRRLSDLGAHAPHALWMRGARGGLGEAPTVAIVGARAATPYGESVAAELGAELAAAGVVVVSGAAYGIDGAAHRAALSADGRTVAFLAGGVDRAYPRGHEALLSRIAASGAVLSETPCGTAPTKWRFLSRNRLIAALADAVIVVEAGHRSGSLNTAAHAATLGRALGAVPGPVTSAASAGSHRVLREFAGVCVTSAADVWEMLGENGGAAAGRAAPDRLEGGRTDDMTRLLDALSPRAGRDPGEIARRAGFSTGDAQSLLGLAELEGRVARGEDGLWRTLRERA
ncbi:MULTISPECIES: DNA-processing protein DprA [Microbacterium]|jgi:DNA processing protein|uniref:DNA-processing protein DprA n=1 Tax=Microbacterium TaxID=33882 RepID=UPI001D173FF1|nr:DNA-processing protein DprA [Microbacterium testaceum]MCC4250601.1 DNA-processing protein DprA [Microbacterium testaceum]